MNRIDGTEFSEAWKERETVPVEHSGKKIRCHFSGIRQLIRNKEALRRHKDFEDLSYLKKRLAERSR